MISRQGAAQDAVLPLHTARLYVIVNAFVALFIGPNHDRPSRSCVNANRGHLGL